MIGMEFRGVSIDLLFARLTQDTVPDDDSVYHEDAILKNLDNATEISLNGPRVTQMIYRHDDSHIHTLPIFVSSFFLPFFSFNNIQK